MDPNANLTKLRRLAQDLLECDGDAPEEAVELAERAQALDEWLYRGGFLPQRWERPDPVDAAMANYSRSENELAWFNHGGKGCDRLQEYATLFAREAGLSVHEAAAVIYGTLLARLDDES